MSAWVVPFPPARRTRFVASQACHIAELGQSSGARHLQRTLKVQADAMLRRGIEPSLIARELKILESAIRAKLWTIILTPGESA